jgi:hypothetical protein
MLFHRGVALPATCRALTVLALYHSYADDDTPFVLSYFPKAKALAEWLLSRRARALAYATTDARYGIPQGDAEEANYVHVRDHTLSPLHFFSSAAEMYRAFTEAGHMWTAIGAATQRADVSAHAATLLATAPLLYHDSARTRRPHSPRVGFDT